MQGYDLLIFINTGNEDTSITMNTIEEVERQINNQLSENREATIEGVSKEMKDEISWAYVKDGFEVSSTEREDGTYDLTVRKPPSVSPSTEGLSAEKQKNIVENEIPDFAHNQVEVYETGKEHPLSGNMKEFWQVASEVMREKLGSVPVENPSVEVVVLSDGFTIAEAPLFRFSEFSLRGDLDCTQELLEVAPECGITINEEMRLCIALMRLALGESFVSVTGDYPEWEDVLAKPRRGALTADVDISDEEIRGLSQLLYDKELVGEPCVIIEDGEVHAHEGMPDAGDPLWYLEQQFGKIERQSQVFQIRINRPVTETRRLYAALSGEGFTALVLVNPDTFFAAHEVTEQRTVASDNPLFVTAMEVELKDGYQQALDKHTW